MFWQMIMIRGVLALHQCHADKLVMLLIPSNYVLLSLFFYFKVLSADGEQEVGEICKLWSGFVKEAFTDADNFGVTFPPNLDVRIKATLLGAVFLIDFMFFEDSGVEMDAPGML